MGTNKIYVMLLSTAAYESDVREGLSVGAQIYITKARDPHELEQAVARLISYA